MTDHDTGRLVWVAALTHVSADGAEFIHTVVSERAPRAVLCLDAFYADLRIMPTWRLSFLVGTLSAVRRSA